jgi:hypothetical protein
MITSTRSGISDEWAELDAGDEAVSAIRAPGAVTDED